jgi:carbonic anhydrase
MSCPVATSPIDIIKQDSNTCDLKCDYAFHYRNTSVRAENKGAYLSFAFDNAAVPPVVYNSEKYQVGRMRLYRPSLHTWNGQHADAEVLIEHSAISGRGNLMVCIPVKAGASSAGVLSAIIAQVGQTAPNAGGSTNISLPAFTLNNVIPRAPFYSYTGTLPYVPCVGIYNYVVFGMEHSIGVNRDTSMMINKLITEAAYPVRKPIGGVFYNKKGAGNALSSGEDEIYIECQPTGEDGETLVPIPGGSRADMPSGASAKDSFMNMIENPVVQGLFGVIVLIALLKIFHAVFMKIFKAWTAKAAGGGDGDGAPSGDGGE